MLLLLVLLLVNILFVYCNHGNGHHAAQGGAPSFTRPPVHIPDPQKIEAHKDSSHKVMVIVPGHGWYGNRPKALAESITLLKQSAVPMDCLLYIYHDREPPGLNQTIKDIIYKSCEVMNYHYANYGDYLKTLPPFLLRAAGYSHVMILLDDIVLHDSFNLQYALQLMTQNNISIAQPAVHGAKFFSTKYHSRAEYGNDIYYIGHRVRIVEVFATIFTLGAWGCWYDMINPIINSAGWGYDAVVGDYCRSKPEFPTFELAVFDCMEATHIDRFAKAGNLHIPVHGVHKAVPVEEIYIPKYAVNQVPLNQKWEWMKTMVERRNSSKAQIREGPHNAFIKELVDLE